MIQRIQTLFLLAAAGLLVSMFFVPMARFPEGETCIRYLELPSCLSLLLISTILCITTIFSFKRRIRQIRLCNLNSLILLGFQIYLAVLFFKREPEMIFSVSAIFPVCAAILTFIAMRYIARDEAMVMAASHLRPSRKGKKK